MVYCFEFRLQRFSVGCEALAIVIFRAVGFGDSWVSGLFGLGYWGFRI